MNPRLVFFGTPRFAVPSLEALIAAKYDIAGIFTAPDRLAGRSRALSPPPVKISAAAHNLYVFQPSTLKDDGVFETFSRLAPDICVVVAYGRLIPKRYLDAPRLGFVNVHPSLLPRWRGPSPVQAAILYGDAETGVSIMLLDEEMDHGPVLAQHRVPLDGTEYAPELSARLSDIGARLLADTLSLYVMDGIQPTEQDHEAATFCKKFSRHDARVDWSWTATRTANMVRALAGEPVAWTSFKGLTLNILRATAHKHQKPRIKPGTVLVSGSMVVVDTPDGTVELELVQPAGRKPMTARDFANGHRDFVGSVLQ